MPRRQYLNPDWAKSASLPRQEVLWIPWEKNEKLVGAGGRFLPVELKTMPDRIWTLFMETDPEKAPTLPIQPVHRYNAFLEDFLHDWTWKRGRLYFGTRVIGCGVWVLLEYDK